MQIPVTGHPLHTRSLTMTLTLDEGGRWRTKGVIVDLRKTGFAPMATSFQPAGLIHHMEIDLQIHPETQVIESLEARQLVVAVEASERSCGESCRDPVANLKALEGESLAAGFAKKLSLAFGGPRGCSHLVALFHFMAGAVLRALELERQQTRAPGVERQLGECVFQRSFFLDGFQNANRDVELALQQGDYHTRPEVISESTLKRLAYEQDIRLFARVRASDLVIQEFRAAERERAFETLASAEWRDRPGWVDALVGAPVIPGFAARAMQSCGEAPEKRVLLDALLQMAPGHLQVLAALADQWISRDSSDVWADSGDTSPPFGGMTPSCYVYRPDGPRSRDIS